MLARRPVLRLSSRPTPQRAAPKRNGARVMRSVTEKRAIFSSSLSSRSFVATPRMTISSRVSRHPISRRMYSTEGARGLSYHLSDKIAEAEQPTEDFQELDELLSASGWEMEMLPEEVVLTRQVTPNETVVMHIPVEPPEEMVETEEDVIADPFTLEVINKRVPDKKLIFHCTTERSGDKSSTAILKITIGDKTMLYDELYEETWPEVERYLEERGINADTPRIVSLALDKHEHLYFVDWMRDLREWLDKCQ